MRVQNHSYETSSSRGSIYLGKCVRVYSRDENVYRRTASRDVHQPRWPTATSNRRLGCDSSICREVEGTIGEFFVLRGESRLQLARLSCHVVLESPWDQFSRVAGLFSADIPPKLCPKGQRSLAGLDPRERRRTSSGLIRLVRESGPIGFLAPSETCSWSRVAALIGSDARHFFLHLRACACTRTFILWEREIQRDVMEIA